MVPLSLARPMARRLPEDGKIGGSFIDSFSITESWSSFFTPTTDSVKALQ
jgi:hypothetical protein